MKSDVVPFMRWAKGVTHLTLADGKKSVKLEPNKNACYINLRPTGSFLGEASMTSYESLADAAFAAAMDIQLRIEGKKFDLANFNTFVKLLKEPLRADDSYKLLNDPRNIPLYKAAWSNVYGNQSGGTKTEDILKFISDLLEKAEDDISSFDPEEVKRIAKFCLTMHSIFLEENGRGISNAFSTRSQHASY